MTGLQHPVYLDETGRACNILIVSDADVASCFRHARWAERHFLDKCAKFHTNGDLHLLGAAQAAARGAMVTVMTLEGELARRNLDLRITRPAREGA